MAVVYNKSSHLLVLTSMYYSVYLIENRRETKEEPTGNEPLDL